MEKKWKKKKKKWRFWELSFSAVGSWDHVISHQSMPGWWSDHCAWPWPIGGVRTPHVNLWSWGDRGLTPSHIPYIRQYVLYPALPLYPTIYPTLYLYPTIANGIATTTVSKTGYSQTNPTPKHLLHGGRV